MIHRLIDCATLYRLFPHRSPDHFSRRLRRLAEHRYIARPPQQARRFRQGGGSFPLAYTYTNRALRTLEQHARLQPSRGARTQKYLAWKPDHIEHQLGVTAFMAEYEMAANEAHVAFLPFQSILRSAPNQSRNRRRPKSFSVPVDWNGLHRRVGLEPDEMFGQRPQGAQKADFFALEFDRGTETISPRSARIACTAQVLDRSYYLRKLIVYAAAFQMRLHRKVLGIPSFRVLTVTTTPQRVDRMQQAYNEHVANLAPARFFLFTDHRALEANGQNPLQTPWYDAAGTKRYLYRPGIAELS